MKKEPSTQTAVETQNERKVLSYDDAIAMLPEGDDIHTFRDGGMLIGADWRRDKILALIKEKGAELSGPMATRMNHGLWVNDGNGRGLFVATK